MNICIVIQDSTLNEIKVKKLTEETIYKKCNYKNNTDFIKLKSWNYDANIIELWGKNKSNYNNKSDYIIFKNNNIDVYGKSIFIMKNDDKYLSLDKKIFMEFFSINENNEYVDLSTHIEGEKKEDKNENEDENEDEDEDENEDEDKDEDDDDDEYLSDNSELSYDAYCYSDEEK